MNSSKHLHELFPIKAGAEVYIMRGTKVLMFKRSETASMFPGYLMGPGGHIDEDEDFLTAAMRELYEETGVHVSARDINLKVLAIHRRPERNETWIMPIFLAFISEHTEIVNSHEGEASWIEKDELLTMKNIFPSAHYYFDHVLNNKPGILYTNIEWKNDGTYELGSQVVDADV